MMNWVLKHKNIIIFLLIFIFALLPRSIEVLSGNYLFGFDQGLFYEDVKKIVIDKKLTLIGAEVGGIGGFFQGPGWNYLLIIPFILFNGNPYGGMVLMLILGLATVLGSFLLFKKEIGIITTLLVCFFIAVSPGIISQSRFIWPPFAISPLTVIFLFCVYKSFIRPVLFIPLTFATIGLMTHFEIATGITLLLATFITFLILLLKKITNPKIILYSASAFFITQISLIIFDLRHNFISSKGILNLIFHNKTLSSSYNLQNHLDIFKDAFLSVSFTLPFFLLTIIISLILFILYLKDKKNSYSNKKFLLFLTLNTFILFLIFLPLKMTLWSWWILEVPIFLCFFLGITLSYGLKKTEGKFLIILIICLYFYLYVLNTINWYKNDFFDYGGTAKIKGKIDAIDYIYSDAKGEKFGLFVFTPPVYTYPYDYLLYWYAGNKYGYIPPREKLKIFYLLMEKDSQKPTSHIGWMETVIIDGKTEKEVVLPSGFIIQKRSRIE